MSISSCNTTGILFGLSSSHCRVVVVVEEVVRTITQELECVLLRTASVVRGTLIKRRKVAWQQFPTTEQSRSPGQVATRLFVEEKIGVSRYTEG
ncbi:unnamed protein product [Calypogeia fissa]